MKYSIIAAAALTVFSLLFPILAGLCWPLEEADTTAPEEYGSLYYIPEPSGDVQVLHKGQVLTMTMSEYLEGAVAAEMPAAFHPEALKAQAVALKTYLMHKNTFSPSHAEADICTDHTCCAAWMDEASLRERWGTQYDTYRDKISQAVSAVEGLYLTYLEEPALAVFHSSSSAMTENAGAVWGEALPYLVSVESPETGDAVPNYVTTVTITVEEFKEKLKVAFPEADFSGDASQWIQSPESTESGRLAAVTLGGVQVTGTKLRSIFSLRSTAITLYADSEHVTFTTTGYGHGVGMSQYGANVLASQGLTFREILARYYPGTELKEE